MQVKVDQQFNVVPGEIEVITKRTCVTVPEVNSYTALSRAVCFMSLLQNCSRKSFWPWVRFSHAISAPTLRLLSVGTLDRLSIDVDHICYHQND